MWVTIMKKKRMAKMRSGREAVLRLGTSWFLRRMMLMVFSPHDRLQPGKRFIQEDLQNLAEELRETEQQLSKLDEGRKNNMIAIRDLEMTKERLLSFAEYAKDAQLEVLVTLIQTIVERIYIVDKDDERFCHIFIKGCADEDYTGFFQTAGYIEQNTTPVCDSEQYCIDNIFFTYVFIRHFFPPLSRLYQSESELIHFFESKFLDESEVIHSGAYTNLYAYPL